MAYRRRPSANRTGAPLWVLSYADLMSLLVVLFVFIYSGRQPPEDNGPVDSPDARIRESSGWMYLGRLPDAARDSLAEIRQRLLGGRSRAALVGFAPTREEAFEVARSARDVLAGASIEGERCLLVAGGPWPASAQEMWVEVYATSGVVGPPAGQ